MADHKIQDVPPSSGERALPRRPEPKLPARVLASTGCAEDGRDPTSQTPPGNAIRAGGSAWLRGNERRSRPSFSARRSPRRRALAGKGAPENKRDKLLRRVRGGFECGRDGVRQYQPQRRDWTTVQVEGGSEPVGPRRSLRGGGQTSTRRFKTRTTSRQRVAGELRRMLLRYSSGGDGSARRDACRAAPISRLLPPAHHSAADSLTPRRLIDAKAVTEE